MMGQLPGAATPASGPSAITPGPQAGVEAQAMIKVKQAVMLLVDTLPILKTQLNSDFGKAVIKAVQTLAPYTPGVEEGLGQSELASMMSGLQGVRHAPPQQPGMLGMSSPKPKFFGGVNRPPM